MAVELIHQLVLNLVELSNSLRTEQALERENSPYHTMRKQIQHTKDSFQHDTLPNNTEEGIDFENSAEEGTDPWAKNNILAFGRHERHHSWTGSNF